MATGCSALDFASAAEVRRAMVRAPWTPLALRVALLIFDFQGLRRGRCELGAHRLACHVYAVELASPAFLDLDARARATRMGRMKRSIKRALAELGDVLTVERRGEGKTSHRQIRTDIVLSRWGDAATTVGGDGVVTPSPPGGGDDAVTPSACGEVTGPSPGGWRARHPRGDDAVTPHREDLLEDLLEDPPPTPPTVASGEGPPGGPGLTATTRVGGEGAEGLADGVSDRPGERASDRSTAPAPWAASSGVELPPRTLAVIAAAPAESAADPPEEPPPAIPDWRAHLERTPADIDEAAKCWARAFELRLGGPLAPNERPKLDEVAVYLWALADSSSRPWSAVARRALDALFADPRLRCGVRRPGGWAKAHMATIADLVTDDAPIPNTLDLDAMREREASARRGRRPGRDAYQRARMTPDLLEGPDFDDGDIPTDDAPRKVIPYGGGSSSPNANPPRSDEPGAMALAAWAAAIRAADGTPPPPSAEDMRHHAEVAKLARGQAGGASVESVLEEWARCWYAWAKVPSAHSWLTWCRSAAAGKAPRPPRRSGFVEAGTDFTDWGDADIVAGGGS